MKIGELKQQRNSPDSSLFIGMGKVEELKQLAYNCKADLIIFDQNLSPVQQRNLEQRLELDVIDRTELILNIFSQRASTKEGKVSGVKLSGERNVDTEAVLISSGIRSNIELIRDTTIEFDRGIKVDKNLKTNIDNVYAAGDVVEINGMTLGLWTAADDQGKIAGANMTGKDMEYTQPKMFSTLQIGDIKVFSVGVNDDFDKVYEYKEDEQGIHHKIFTKDGKMVGGILFGDLKDISSVRKAVLSKLEVEEFISTNKKFK